GIWFAWVATLPLPRFTSRTRRTVATVAAIVTIVARAVVLLFLANLGEIEDLALVDPDLDADDAVGGAGFSETVVDVGAQGVQRHTAFAVPLRTGNFCTIQAATHVDLDAQGTQTHRVADRALHCTAEHDATLQLLRDGLGNQLCVQLRLAHFSDVDVRRDAHHLAHFLTQLLDVLTTLADHHARTGGVDRHARGLCRTLDQDLADAGLCKLLAQHFANFQVGCQITSKLGLVGVPLGVPILGNTEADTNRMNFMPHGLFL